MKQLIDRVWEYAQNNPDGFTINIESMKPVKFGIAVAFRETQNSFGYENLKRIIDHALANDKTVGGWFDDKDGSYYFDSVKIFRNAELNAAIQFGIENEQIAIFDLTNLQEIRL